MADLAPDLFAELVRGHLVPRSNEPEERIRWGDLWCLLAEDDDLNERAFDALEQMLDATEDALESGALTEAQQRRARQFRSHCDQAWKRIEVGADDSSTALRWAAEKAVKFNAPSRRVISTLIGAIAQHRAMRRAMGGVHESDKALWAVLRQVDLDPDDYGTRRRRR